MNDSYLRALSWALLNLIASNLKYPLYLRFLNSSFLLFLLPFLRPYFRISLCLLLGLLDHHDLLHLRIRLHSFSFLLLFFALCQDFQGFHCHAGFLRWYRVCLLLPLLELLLLAFSCQMWMNFLLNSMCPISIDYLICFLNLDHLFRRFRNSNYCSRYKALLLYFTLSYFILPYLNRSTLLN